MSNNNYILLLLMLWLVAGVVQAQSTVVAVRTPTKIIVGADSRRTTIVNTDSMRHTSVCKLFERNGTIFTMVGMVGDLESDYDPQRLVLRLLENQDHPDFRRSVDAIAGALLKHIQTELIRQKRDDPQSYAYTVKKQEKVGAIVSALFATIQEGIPIIETRNFGIVNFEEPALEINSSSCGASCEKNIFYLGHSAAIQEYLASLNNAINLTPKETVGFLIRLQAQATPDFVAAPVDIAEISHNGVTWFHRKSECVLN